MGQEVKNPLRAQSKYGLMGSSAKTGFFFFEGHWSTFWIKMPFGIGHPSHLHINCSLHVWGRVQGSQIFKRNSIISIRSKVMAFLVISLSPWSPHCPRGPHVVPVIPTSSPCHARHPHIVPIAPRRSPCGPHDLWSPLSPPHVVPVIPMVPTSSPHRPRVVPIIPTSSRRPHIIPNPPDMHSTHPPPLGGWGALNQ